MKVVSGAVLLIAEAKEFFFEVLICWIRDVGMHLRQSAVSKLGILFYT